jgi:hypothetical protein
MKCPLCEQRKGKRSCPAKEASICAQCCGEKRVLEIDCPETCDYLKVGRDHEARFHRQRHLYTPDPVQYDKRRRVFQEYEDVLAEIEVFLAEERHANRSLLDKTVAEALDLLLETLRTEQRGIIYERTSSDPEIESLRRRMKELMDAHLNPSEGKVRRLRVGEVLECLEVIRELVASHLKDDSTSLSYVDFLARLLPRSRRLAGSSPSIIIPGR